MSASPRARPAGTPSMTAVSAWPCDSPAVRKRKISGMAFRVPRRARDQGRARAGAAARAPGSLLRGRRRRCGRGAVDRPQDGRRHEDDQLSASLGLLLLLEEPAEQRDIAEDRYLADGGYVGRGGDAANDEVIALLDEDLSFRLALVDRGGLSGAAEVHGVAARVVLDDDDQLDLGDVAFPDDRRGHLELQERFLELDLSPRRADRGVGDLLAERHDGLIVLDRHHFRT